MNKADLVDAIASKTGMSKVDSKSALESMITAIEKALKKGERLTLIGFGSFSVTKRAARKGRNPQTGAEIQISAKKVVKFKPGTELANSIK